MNLSKHFKLNEFLHSDTAIKNKIDNTPTPEAMENMKRLALFLEQVRSVIGKPLIITSGYRNYAVNKLVGGVKNSQHMSGLAVDIKVSGMTPYQVCKVIESSGLVYDQLILEYDNWTHLAIHSEGSVPRNMKLTYRGNSKMTGIVPK